MLSEEKSPQRGIDNLFFYKKKEQLWSEWNNKYDILLQLKSMKRLVKFFLMGGVCFKAKWPNVH